MEGKFKSFYDDYNNTFDILRADTPELLNEVHKLRYQVYCVEHEWVNASSFPDHLEQDVYDEHSVHSLLVHKRSGMAYGSVRIVIPDKSLPEEDWFPLQKLCEIDSLNDTNYIQHAGEVSRFCISKEMRKRVGDTIHANVYITNQEEAAMHRVIPYGPLGLIRAVFEMSIENNLTSTFATMEPTLIRLLHMLGLDFIKKGPLVENHGMRQPLIMDPQMILSGVKKKESGIWEVITDKGRIENDLNKLVASM
jgi:N-acyl amino acid synthase of PEP-CTERM/exosortase system